MSDWKKQAAELEGAGFTPGEIQQEQERLRGDMLKSGFSGKEADEFFGTQEPDMSPIKSFFKENFSAYMGTMAKGAAALVPGGVDGVAKLGGMVSDYLGGDGPADPNAKVEQADSFTEALKAGFQDSSGGLLLRGKLPDTVLPEDAPMFYKIASQLSHLAGDVPAMVAGGVVGGVVGGAATGPAAPIGATLGAAGASNALPAGLRKILMDHYEKGDVADFSDFWSRASATFIEESKQFAIGAATGGVGGKITGRLADPKVAVTAAAATKAAIAEVATMVSLGRAFEGEVPKVQDFTEAALVVGFMHGSLSGASKLRKIYAETGVKPTELAQQAMSDPVLKQDLLSSNVDVPSALAPLKQNAKAKPVDAPAPTIDGEPSAPAKPVEPHPSLIEPSAVLDPEAPSTARPDLLSEAGKVGTDINAEQQKPVEGPVRSESAQAVIDRIGVQETAAKPYSFDKFYTDVVDRLHPIKRFTEALAQGKPLNAGDSPYIASRLMAGVPRMVEQFLKYSPFEFGTRKNVGKSFESIIEPFKADVQEFEGYLVAKRALELESQGIKSGIPLEQAKKFVSESSAKYDTAARELTELQNHALKYLKDAGILSDKAFKLMTEQHQDYIPFYRLMEEGAGSRGAGKGLTVKNPVKGIKGSERMVARPLESVVKNIEMYITLAERNRVGTKMLELVEANPEVGKTLMERVKPNMRGIKLDVTEVQNLLIEHGVDIASHDMPEAFTIFRPDNIVMGANEIAVFRNGKREIYKVHPEVANAIKEMDSQTSNLFIKMLAAPAKLLRAGTVLTPDFALRNFTRDQITAYANSKSGYNPLFTALDGMRELMSKGEVYQNWLKSGGANAEINAIKKLIDEDIYGLSKQTGLLDKTWNVLKTPLEVLTALSGSLEEISRLGEFKRVAGENASAAKIREAGFASREVTVDMARIGAKTKAINQIIAFWNIGGIQGTDRIIRSFKDDPVGVSAKLFSAVTIPSILLWYANKDDPRWREIPRWQKDAFWIVMTKEHVFRIPKPHAEGMLFGSLAERVLDKYFTDNEKAGKDFADSLVSGFIPGFVPTALQPIFEQKFNKSFFTGANIVPHNLEKIAPQYQYTDYTTDAGKILGKMVAMVPGMRESSFASPMVLENYIRGWSGNLGMYALKAADQLLYKTGVVPEPVKPASTLADIPFIKAFVIRHPSASAQSIQDFYDTFQRNKQTIDTIRHLARNGDFENMRKELSLKENQQQMLQLDGMREALGNQSHFIQMVNRNTTLTRDEKRQIIDGIYNGMIETAKLGNKMLSTVEKSIK